MKRQTHFYRWLMRFAKDDSPRGDLARDARSDADGVGQVERGYNWNGSLEQLATLTKGTAAEDAYKAARRAYLRALHA